ncbi:MAG: RNA polymerase sigma factor [Bacteroidota bacterium]
MEQNKQAFVELIAKNQGIIHKVCSMYTRSEEDHRDLFQEVLVQLWRAYGSFAGKSKISTWMYRIALNTAISGLRKKERRPQPGELNTEALQLPGIERDPELEEKKTFLYKAIEQLSKVEKAIVMLHLEDHSYEEIAAIIGITKTNVGVKLNRIKGKLRKIMKPHFQ